MLNNRSYLTFGGGIGADQFAGKSGALIGAMQDPEQNGLRAEQTHLPQGSGQVVLVVEDDPSLRRLIGIQLQGLGYRVMEVEDGKTALEILETDDRIDLLLTDIVMPEGLSGTELASKAHTLRPDLKVLFVSAYPHARAANVAELGGDAILLQKPFRRTDLAVRVKKALSK